MSIPPEKRDTPAARLAVVARKVIDKKFQLINEHRAPEHKTELPAWPTDSDFLDFMEPYIELELLRVEIKASQIHPSYQDVLDLMEERSKVEAYIAEHPL
jgi:hypothetical protein